MSAADSEVCRRCGGQLRVIASIEETARIERILEHLGGDGESVDPAQPSRAPPQGDAVYRYHGRKEVVLQSPRLLPRALAHTAGGGLLADLDAGSTAKTGKIAIAASAATIRDNKLDPECVVTAVVRGVTGVAQRIQAALFRARACGGESR